MFTYLLLCGFAVTGAYGTYASSKLTPASANKSDSKTRNVLGNKTDLMETLEFRGKTYYLVFHEAQLRAIGTGKYGMNKNYLQQADISLSSDEWIPIGTKKNPFTGSYNGSGYEIKGLTMINPNANVIGMFGYAKNASIYNIILRNYDILSAGKNVKTRSIAPILVFVENIRGYDNSVYPKK